MRLLAVSSVVLASVACGQASSPRGVHEVESKAPPVASTAVGTPAGGVSHKNRTEVAWPEGNVSAIEDDSTLTWTSGKASGQEPTGKPNGTLVKDLDGDGKAELVVFISGAEGAPAALNIFTMVKDKSDAVKVARMYALESQLFGVADEAAFNRELPNVKSLGPTTGVPLERLVARLPAATLDELRALVSKSGVSICKRQGEKKSCKKIAHKAIDAKNAKAILDHGGRIAERHIQHEQPMSGLSVPGCSPDEKKPNVIACFANEEGPVGGSWTFEKDAQGVRLIEVWQWAEDS